MTFTINKRMLTAFVTVLSARSDGRGYRLSGRQASRKSDDAVALLVSKRVTDANAATNAERDLTQTKAVKRAAKRAKHRQYRKDQRRWKKYSKKLVDRYLRQGLWQRQRTRATAPVARLGTRSGHLRRR